MVGASRVDGVGGQADTVAPVLSQPGCAQRRRGIEQDDIAAWAGGAPEHLARDARVLLRPTAPHGPWVGPIQAGIGGAELIFLASAVDPDHERSRAPPKPIHP